MPFYFVKINKIIVISKFIFLEKRTFLCRKSLEKWKIFLYYDNILLGSDGASPVDRSGREL